MTFIMVWLSGLNYAGVQKSSISCFFFNLYFLITNDVNHLFMRLLDIGPLTSVYVLLLSKTVFFYNLFYEILYWFVHPSPSCLLFFPYTVGLLYLQVEC